MPITPAYEWREAESSVSIDVKIRAVTAASADILLTDCYAKINCSPYFFEADLYEEVDPRKSSAFVDRDVVKFFIVKKHPGLWGRLTLPGDRMTILERRHRSLATLRDLAKQEREEFPAKFANIGRLAVGQQMKLEEAKRKAITQRKEEELRAQQEDLKIWMTKCNDTTNANVRTSHPLASEAELSNSGRTIRDDHSSLLVAKECGIESIDDNADNQRVKRPSHSHSATYQETASSTWLPAPRRSSSVLVKFSVKADRPIHLPARESRDVIQLKKKAAADPKASNPTEQEPIFLQDKGENFFKSGDYESAVNAYSSALEADPSLIVSLANRAACRLQLRQYEDCSGECVKALQLLQHVFPSKTIDASSNILPVQEPDAKVERGKSDETELLPSNLQLLKCIKSPQAVGEEIEKWEVDVKKHLLILLATAKYYRGEVQQALQKYSQALEFEPTHEELNRVIRHLKSLMELN